MGTEDEGPLGDVTRWARLILARYVALHDVGVQRGMSAAELGRWLRGEGPGDERIARARAIEAEIEAARGSPERWSPESPEGLRWHEFMQLGQTRLEKDLLVFLVAFDTHPRIAAGVRAVSGWPDACGVERSFMQALLDPFERDRTTVAELLRSGHALFQRAILRGLGERDAGRPRFVELSPAVLTWLFEGPAVASQRLGRLRWEAKASQAKSQLRQARYTAGYDFGMLEHVAERLARDGRVRVTASASEDVIAAARVIAESAEEPVAVLELGRDESTREDASEVASLCSQAALIAELSTAVLVITGLDGAGRPSQEEGQPVRRRASAGAIAQAIEASRVRVIIADTMASSDEEKDSASSLTADLARRLSCVTMALPFPDETRRVEVWRRLIHPKAQQASMVERLARFPLSPAQISGITAQLSHEVGPEVWVERCRDAVGHRVGELAQRVKSSASWNEVILPEPVMDVVKEVLLYAREGRRVLQEWGLGARHAYGLGLSALFSGPPGTGKTLLAGLIAKELGLDLFRIDLSRIVSKYIGETEQRLGRLFDEARRGGVALLFDEADSLFATRTEVKSSVDRYANLEVNFLLQKMEHYDGLVILTTNLAESLDEAFRRRIRFHARFPLPNAAERARLWRSMIPKTAPQSPNIDWDTLAQVYEFSGGEIKNAALRAAFYAADAGKPIDLSHLDRASQAEYRERGRLILKTAIGNARPYR